MVKSECRVLGDVWVFNLKELEWKSVVVAGSSPSAREMATGTMISPSEMLICGGRGPNGALLDDACLLDVASATWRGGVHHERLLRCAHSAVLFDETLPPSVWLVSLKLIISPELVWT
jgi:hypothetical protein